MVALRHSIQTSSNFIAIAAIYEYGANIDVSLTLKILGFVSKSAVGNAIIYGESFMKTSNFQNIQGDTCADVIILCVET